MVNGTPKENSFKLNPLFRAEVLKFCRLISVDLPQ